MAAEPTDDEVTARLREACRRMAEPVAVRDPDAIPDGTLSARLREACDLWVLCASLAGARP
jgi:hypothetical protein